jgi:hypothetical protein
MADVNETPTAPEATLAEVEAPAAVVPPAITLRTEIADRLATTAPVVREAVIAELTTKEITARKDAVLTLLTKFDDKSKELKKAENGGAYALDIDGKKVGDPTFTKEQVEAIKKLREEISGISTALSNFFDKNDTKKLYELAKK